MRTLTLSLIFVALIATVGLGWLFDNLFSTEQGETDHVATDATLEIERLGYQLADAIAKQADPSAFIEHWQASMTNQDFDYELAMMAFDALPLPPSLQSQLQRGEALLLMSTSGLAFHYYLPNLDQILVLKSPILNKEARENSANYLITTLFYILLLLLLLLWAVPLLRQLLALRRTARLFGEGQLHRRIRPSAISYIRDIETEFNRMAQRIEQLVADIKLLSSAVSHDLRTPLARIRFGLDTLREEEEPELKAQFEQKLSQNVDEMTSLVETLLIYSRLEQNMLELKKSRVNLSQLLSDCIDSNRDATSQISYREADTELNVLADARLLTMALNNLLQNAINYGRERVQVSLNQRQDLLVLTIADDGDGIDDELIDRIFLPFVRGEKTAQHKQGHGVGLAIVKRVIDWHQGSVSISRSTSLGGAKLTVTLPSPGAG